MERKDEMERIISSGTCSISGILATSLLRALAERIFSSGTCSMRGIAVTGMLTSLLIVEGW